MTLGFDPYTVLGVPFDATGHQIAQARRRLLRKYHPDVNPALDAAARFDEVQRAFRLLSDPAARAEYDRTRGRPGATPAAGGPGRTDGTAASRFSVHPASVNFGVVEPGNSRAYADVVVYWTGPPPRRIWTEPGNEWWTVASRGKLALSGVVFHLRAQAPAGGATGRQHAELKITLDGTAIEVPLTAEFGVRFSSSAGEQAKSSQPTPRWLRGFGAVIWVTLGIVANVLFSHHKPGNGGAAAASASTAAASAYASQVDASHSAAMAEAAAQAMATPPATPAKVPQAREAPIKVRPAFTASGPVLDKSTQSSAGISGPPVLHGFELLVPVASKPDPAAGFPKFCMEVTVPASGGTSLAPGAAGNTYTEYPLGTVAVRGGTALAFPAALPGRYAYYPGGCSGYGPGPFTLGTVTVSNIGVADGIIYIDPTNAMVVYGVRTRGNTTTLTYGAVGGTASSPGPGIIPPANDSCLDTYYRDTGRSAYWQPVQSRVSQQVTGTDQWLETGTMIFRGITVGSPLVFYYNCVEAAPIGPPGAGSPAGLAVP